MTHFEPAAGLDQRVAEAFLAPRIEHLASRVEDEAKRGAPDGKTWVTRRDERVRPSHVYADGQEVPDNLRYKIPKVNTGNDLNDIRAGFDLARAPRDPDLPIGNRINCFPANTTVLAPGLRGGYRRWYSGPMVTVYTSSRRMLTGTPNHPVLTERGWIALGDLDVGRDHVYAVVGDLVDTARSEVGRLEPDVEREPTVIGKVLDALAVAHLPERVAGAHVDFHGDGLDGDVYVVRPQRSLQDGAVATLAQSVRQVSLVGADASAGVLPGDRLAGALVVAGLRATARLVGRHRPRAALLRRRSIHPGAHGRSAPTGLDTGREQGLSNVPAGGAVDLGQTVLGLARHVSLDEIVDKRIVEWSGHVYNLETAYDSYLANGLVVHNCRCESAPIPGAVARDIARTPTQVMGTTVRSTITCAYPRAAEAEYGTDRDSGAHFMSGALHMVAIEAR